MLCQRFNLDMSEIGESMLSFYNEYRDFSIVNPHCPLDQWPESFIDAIDLQSPTPAHIFRDGGDTNLDAPSEKHPDDTDYERFLKEGNSQTNLSEKYLPKIQSGLD
jgi:hypothetical protein